MKHLSHAELADAIESPSELPPHRARHARECAACRGQADALRVVLARAAEDRAPEPSPLFWDHFGERVADAVRAESIQRRSVPWFERLHPPLTAWAAAAIVLMVVSLTILWRATLHAPAPVFRLPQPSAASTSARSPASVSTDNADVDERWAVVRVAAEDLGWEDVRDAGISAHPGQAEGVALELTPDERSELARLIDQELKRNGV
jgi:hypothetical protein